jgi:hypothetical protein
MQTLLLPSLFGILKKKNLSSGDFRMLLERIKKIKSIEKAQIFTKKYPCGS